MTIANPMYDTVFKRLMENDRVVKFFIGTLLEEEVLSVNVRPQEYTYKSDGKSKKSKKEDDDNSIAGLAYSIYRVDFIAIVKTKEGEHKKILIEVQKGKDEDDVIRFRNYLGDQYKREDKVDGKSVVLPIITIYILGFNLSKPNSPCFKGANNFTDLLNHQPIDVESPFVAKLTHDTYIIQTRRIALTHYRTKLEQLLGIFEQAYFLDNLEILKRYHQSDDDNKDIQLISSILHEMGTDPDERKKIEDEAEALRTWEELYGRKIRAEKEANEELAKVLEETRKDNKKQVKALKEKDKALEEKAKALEEKAKALEEKDKALEETKKANEELLKQLAEMKDKQK
jgi:hypothetical protein